MRNTALTLAFLLMVILISCNGNGEPSESANSDSDEFVEYQYIDDSINGTAVSHDCAIAYTKLQELQWRWERISSPSTLAARRATWNSDRKDVEKQIADLDGEQKQTLDSLLKVITTIYDRQCREYSVPASGVIANLESCISRIDTISSRLSFEIFRDCRRGTLNSLGTIHLCLEPGSRETGKVKHLAETLARKYADKCTELGVSR